LPEAKPLLDFMGQYKAKWHPTGRISMRARRKQAALNDDYMLSFLAG
jgi:hypothetical protein